MQSAQFGCMGPSLDGTRNIRHAKTADWSIQSEDAHERSERLRRSKKKEENGEPEETTKHRGDVRLRSDQRRAALV